MNRNKIMAGVLTMSVTAGAVASPMAVLAADHADTGSEKEEVVYVMTDAEGSVDNVNVVNIFGKGDITDYGDYSAVKLLTQADEITQNGDKITFTSDKDKVYYQGTMEEAEIPWNIRVSYTLDGREIAPEKLAGESGALDVHIEISRNEKCSNADFYDNYALQVTMALDTEKCENITAEGATLANVGADKQMSYTILPGKGLDAHVTADVKDFEMDALEINGIKLNLDVDIDTSELTEKVTEIMDAAKALNEGSSSLLQGSGELQSGSGDLKDGASSLYSGAGSLNSGIQTLKQGVTSMQSGLAALDEKKQQVNELNSGAQNLAAATSYQAYKDTMAQNGLDIDQLNGQNAAMIETLNTQIANMQATVTQIQQIPEYEQDAQYVAAIQQLQTQIAADTNTIALLQGDMAAISGTETYFGNVNAGAQTLAAGVSEMQTALDSLNGTIQSGYTQLVDGVNGLASGSKQLLDGAGVLQEGTASLYDGVAELCDGAAEMNDGTEEFCEKTEGMDVTTEEEIDEMIASITGEETETTSFVSDKNENVESVQFVIKTSAIEKAEVEEDTETTETKTSVIDKFLQLFR